MGNCMGGTKVVEVVDTIAWSRAHPAINISGAKAKMTQNDYAYRCALADGVMKDGRHFCEFTVVCGDDFKIGVVRPDYGAASNEKTSHMKDAHLEREHCAKMLHPRRVFLVAPSAMIAGRRAANKLALVCTARRWRRLLRRAYRQMFPERSGNEMAWYGAWNC